MPGISIVYSMILIILGLTGYFISDTASVTALIPAFFGVVILVLGLLAFKEKLRRHMMHVVSVLALIGFIANISSLSKYFRLLGGESFENEYAIIFRFWMAVVSIVFFLIFLNSFIKARIAKKQAEG